MWREREAEKRTSYVEGKGSRKKNLLCGGKGKPKKDLVMWREREA